MYSVIKVVGSIISHVRIRCNEWTMVMMSRSVQIFYVLKKKNKEIRDFNTTCGKLHCMSHCFARVLMNNTGAIAETANRLDQGRTTEPPGWTSKSVRVTVNESASGLRSPLHLLLPLIMKVKCTVWPSI